MSLQREIEDCLTNYFLIIFLIIIFFMSLVNKMQNDIEIERVRLADEASKYLRENNT